MGKTLFSFSVNVLLCLRGRVRNAEVEGSSPLPSTKNHL